MKPNPLFTKFSSAYPTIYMAVSATLPITLATLYCLLQYALGLFRTDHWVASLIMVTLSYTGGRTRELRNFLLPLLLTGIVYDSQKIWGDWVRGTIHISQPYQFDLTLFGINTPQGRLTPNQYFQQNTHPVLDIITGFYYLAFFILFQLQAAYYRFWLGLRGTLKLGPKRVTQAATRKLWAFFGMNVCGYLTYYIYPAAPPWYVEKYGLGPANMTATPSAAGAVRFDQALGTHFFDQLYGRSADVFGAIPSLHVAMPALALLYSYRIGSLKFFSWTFYLIMFFASVYLNHHYVIDGLMGTLYAALAFCIAEYIIGSEKKETPGNIGA